MDRAGLRRAGARLLSRVGLPRAELSVSLVDDGSIAELNRSFRGRRGPTDVLAFSLLEGDHVAHRGALLGEVVIGVDVAARQARQAHRSLHERLLRLLIHGLLHLLGHDHQEEEEARRMRREERRLWREVREERPWREVRA